MAQPAELSLAEASAAIRKGALSPVELTQAYLERIARHDGELGAYATVTPELALKEARLATEVLAKRGRHRPLLGIPVSVKDTIATKGVLTAAASALYADRIPDSDAGVVTRLKKAGAIILGKASCTELGFLGLPKARNPWDIRYSPGASSSGSAASVAGRLALGSIAGDSGGSIRNPAALCGISGFKPTFGRIARSGVLPLSYSFDTLGPMAHSAEDCAVLYDALVGSDPDDPAGLRDVPRPVSRTIDRSKESLRIGVPWDFIEATGMTADVSRAFSAVLTVLGRQCAEVIEVSIPFLKHARAVNWTIMRCEGFNVHRRALMEQPGLFSPVNYRALAVGGFLAAEDYLRAQQARTLISRAVAKAFGRVDVLVLPTRPDTAAGGELLQRPRRPEDAIPTPAANYVSFLNVTGGPAISIPCGFDQQGLPIGVQLAGRPRDDAKVLVAAHGYQTATTWHTLSPKLI